MPRFDSDLDHRAYFYGEDPPNCVDCDAETTLIDPADKAPRCAPCQEARALPRTDYRQMAIDQAYERRYGVK